MSKASNKKTAQKLSELERKERKQERELGTYRKQEHRMKWAIIIILVLLLLMFLMVGFATNWFKGDSRDMQRSAADTQLTDGTGQSSTAGGGASTRQTTGGTISRTSDGSSSSNSSKESSNSSTMIAKETSTDDSSRQALLDLDSALDPGDNINDIKSLADSLGIAYECGVVLLTIEECTFGTGDSQIVTRSPLLNDTITSISDNF